MLNDLINPEKPRTRRQLHRWPLADTLVDKAIDTDTTWIELLNRYELEFDGNHQPTGWYRCVGGRLADGTWPEFHSVGLTRYSI